MKTPLFVFVLCVFYLSSTAQTAMLVNRNQPISLPIKAQTNLAVNNIPPRFQWNQNNGYCGEVSLISAGMYYGQYLSQFDARSCGTLLSHKPNASQLKAVQDTQLLLGGNANRAAHNMRLRYEQHQSINSQEFLTWVKTMVKKGYPVIIGVLNNCNALGEGSSPIYGDSCYDHIVPVVGFSNTNVSYTPTDEIIISDNGIFTGTNNTVPTPEVQYFFNYTMKNFVTNRVAINTSATQIYGLLDLPKHQSRKANTTYYNYGIAILGIEDSLKETYPVQLSTEYNYEVPSIDNLTNNRPSALKMKMKITVSNLTPGQTYLLIRYKDWSDVPNCNFAKSDTTIAKQESFVAKSTSEEFSRDFKTNEQIIYRVVKKQ